MSGKVRRGKLAPPAGSRTRSRASKVAGGRKMDVSSSGSGEDGPRGGNRARSRSPQESPAAGTRARRRAETGSSNPVSAHGGSAADAASIVQSPGAVGRSAMAPGKARQTRQGGEAPTEMWGLAGAGESANIYAARIASHLAEYDEQRRRAARVRKELAVLRGEASSVGERKRVKLRPQIAELKAELQEIEAHRLDLLAGSGPFREKLENDDRFRAMSSGGLQCREPQVESDNEAEVLEILPGSGESNSLAETCSGIPPGQGHKADTGEEWGMAESPHPGGSIMTQVHLLESPPVDLALFSFGDDMPEEDQRVRAPKPKVRVEETLSFVTLSPGTPAGEHGGCISPLPQPSPDTKKVCPAQEERESEGTKVGVKYGTTAVCSGSSGKNTEGARLAGKPDSVATGQPRIPGVAGLSLVGEGGDRAPGVVRAVSGAPKGVPGAAETTPAPSKSVGPGVGPGGKLKEKKRHLEGVQPLTGSVVVDGNQAAGHAGPVGAPAAECMESMEVGLSEEGGTSGEGQGASGGRQGASGGGQGNGDVGVSGGVSGGVSRGPAAPPVVAAPARSYANVTAGGSASLPSASGDGNLQRRLMEALRNGESKIMVEGREVDLTFYTDRFGSGAFQEKQSGETRWSLPTTGQGQGRRNVVRLRWRGSEICPTRSVVVELLFEMGFRVEDIFALIHPYGTPEFDVSFVRPEGLEAFWAAYELAKGAPGWRDFAVQAISRQNQVKRVTILTRNETLSCIDIMTWLGRYGEVVGMPRKNLDDHGIWSGAWTFMVKLKVYGFSVSHIPSSTYLGRDRILAFYQGQPKLCHRCGDPTHMSASCKVQRCGMCGGEGHLAASCALIRCNLCGELGHPFSRCPRSAANAGASSAAGAGGGASGGGGPRSAANAGASSAAGAGGGASGGGGPVRPEGLVKNKKTHSQVRRSVRLQGERDSEASQAVGRMTVPIPEGSAPTEAPQAEALEEEVRRIEREQVEEDGSLSENSWVTEASLSDGSDDGSQQESQKWRQIKKKRKRNKKGVAERSGPPRSSTDQVPKEAVAGSPRVVLSRRFQALEGDASLIVSGEVDPGGREPPLQVSSGQPGGAESSPRGVTVPLSEGAGPDAEGKDACVVGGGSEVSGDLGGMDMSVSLKRSGGSPDPNKEKSKRKAVEVNHS